MQLLLQSSLLILSFILIYIWQQTILSSYTIPLIGFFIFLFLITSFRKKPIQTISTGAKLFSGDGSLTIFFLNTAIFLLIFATGGLTSPLFFLLYFLGFSIGFVLRPITVFIFTLGSLAIFFPEIIVGNFVEHVIKVGSLVLISPLAYFFGLQNQNQETQEENLNQLKEKTKTASESISRNAKDLIGKEKQNLSPEEISQLEEIEDKANELQKQD